MGVIDVWLFQGSERPHLRNRRTPTDKEKAFIRARFEQALLSKTLKPLQLFAKISKEVGSMLSALSRAACLNSGVFRKKDWLKELKVLPVRTADRNRSHRETNASNSEAEVNLPIANRTDGGVPYSSPEEPDNDSDHSQGEMRSVIEAPPKAPPRHDFSRHTGTTYTVTDREFIIDYLAWAERNNIKSSSSVLAGMHELMPWHSQQSISSFGNISIGILISLGSATSNISYLLVLLGGPASSIGCEKRKPKWHVLPQSK
ncbi:hypothetical protein FRB90_008839 [Tulasnella sp. 427]|nr:hypothetical protein FRB90_008839 [Tulasnella sp. 427]